MAPSLGIEAEDSNGSESQSASCQKAGRQATKHRVQSSPIPHRAPPAAAECHFRQMVKRKSKARGLPAALLPAASTNQPAIKLQFRSQQHALRMTWSAALLAAGGLQPSSREWQQTAATGEVRRPANHQETQRTNVANDHPSKHRETQLQVKAQEWGCRRDPFEGGLDFDDSALQSERHRVGPVFGAEFGENVFYVTFDGFLCDRKLVGDELVRIAGLDERKNLDLSRR
jgi:hypothetical protein